jgi:hypothetical protein
MNRVHFARLVLSLGALAYLGLGLWLSFKPEGLQAVGVQADSAAARTELRATYGGLELGLGLFLAWCLCGDPARLKAGLLATALTVGGFGCVRALGIVLDRPPQRIFLVLLGVEVVMTAISVVALGLLPSE